jgi:hypothetical protein
MTIFQLALFFCSLCILLISLGTIAWIKDHQVDGASL